MPDAVDEGCFSLPSLNDKAALLVGPDSSFLTD